MKTMRAMFMATFFLMVFTMGSGRLFAQGATISGKVAFEGEAPPAKPINFGAERQCALMHGDKQPVNEELIVNPNKTVKWVLVYVKEGVTGTYPTPTTPVEVDQAGCMFSPHVSAAMVGQTVKFKNSDELLHNVRTVAKVNKVFNIAQPVKGMSTDKVFDSAEIGIGLRCDVHFWMAAYIHVLSSPFFAITGDDGTFAVKDLPAGTYTIELWHEKLGTQTQTVTVADSETKTLDFTLKQA
ncbi:MAG: carboxypeptidase regulatory-like domain-containing protein [Candidatus Omnitrophica bacterium]|nr:carboxypeptidase regulatory-like domain-containing protein [Candidatus Omnitrophota bacterium]